MGPRLTMISSPLVGSSAPMGLSPPMRSSPAMGSSPPTGPSPTTALTRVPPFFRRASPSTCLASWPWHTSVRCALVGPQAQGCILHLREWLLGCARGGDFMRHHLRCAVAQRATSREQCCNRGTWPQEPMLQQTFGLHGMHLRCTDIVIRAAWLEARFQALCAAPRDRQRLFGELAIRARVHALCRCVLAVAEAFSNLDFA